MRMLGITSAEPFAQAPDVPVMAGQAGLPEDFRAELWNAFIAPAGTDPAVIERLNAEINDILAEPEVQEKLLAIGWQAAPGTPEELEERIAADTEMWGAVIDRIEAASSHGDATRLARHLGRARSGRHRSGRPPRAGRSRTTISARCGRWGRGSSPPSSARCSRRWG